VLGKVEVIEVLEFDMKWGRWRFVGRKIQSSGEVGLPAERLQNKSTF